MLFSLFPLFFALLSYLRVCASRSLCSHRLLGLSTRLSLPASGSLHSSHQGTRLTTKEEEEEEEESLKIQTTDLKERRKLEEKRGRRTTPRDEEKELKEKDKAATQVECRPLDTKGVKDFHIDVTKTYDVQVTTFT